MCLTIGIVLIQTEASSIFYGFAMSKYEHQVHPMLLLFLKKKLSNFKPRF